MPKLIIISPKVGFESASNLAEVLGVPYENPFETGNRNYKQYDFVFKYGFSRKIVANKVLNKTKNVEISRDKIKTLDYLKEVCLTVPYTKDIKEAEAWIKSGVVARNLIKGADGEGVEFCWNKTDLAKAKAKFYTKYIKHTNEFRVNIFRDIVVSVYDKIDKNGIFNFKLFKGVENHPQLQHIAKCVHEKVGLDWCGVDVLRDSKGNLHLLEVNSAPVLYPHTLHKLAAILKKEMSL